MMSDVKLMKPLFYCGNFNAGGKRMKAVLVKEVSDGANAYRLWRSSGVPDRDYPRAEDYLRTYREQTEELRIMQESTCGWSSGICPFYIWSTFFPQYIRHREIRYALCF